MEDWLLALQLRREEERAALAAAQRQAAQDLAAGIEEAGDKEEEEEFGGFIQVSSRKVSVREVPPQANSHALDLCVRDGSGLQARRTERLRIISIGKQELATCPVWPAGIRLEGSSILYV